MEKYDSSAYKRSRAAYTVQCAMQYLVTLMVTDTFLAKLLKEIGISDALTGIISSFVSMACIIQLFSIFLANTKLSAKKIVIIGDTVSIFFFMLLYLVPFMPVSSQVKTGLVIISIIVAYVGNYLISTICFKWANSFVHPWKRASFSAVKEMFSLVMGMLFSLFIGYVIDNYEAAGNLNGGFKFIAIAILILNVANVICYLMIKEDTGEEKREDKPSFSEVVRYISHNEKFLNFMLLRMLYAIATYFTLGFMGVFKTSDLMISVFLVQIINVIASLARLIVTAPFGRYSDKHSYTKGYKLGIWIAAAGFLINVFTTRETWFLVIVYTILYNVSQAGISQNGTNMAYLYVDEEYFSQALSITNAISGICGFIASLAAGKLLAMIQANGNQLFGLHLYGQQVLSAISALLLLGCVVLVNKKMKD